MIRISRTKYLFIVDVAAGKRASDVGVSRNDQPRGSQSKGALRAVADQEELFTRALERYLAPTGAGDHRSAGSPARERLLILQRRRPALP